MLSLIGIIILERSILGLPGVYSIVVDSRNSKSILGVKIDPAKVFLLYVPERNALNNAVRQQYRCDFTIASWIIRFKGIMVSRDAFFLAKLSLFFSFFSHSSRGFTNREWPYDWLSELVLIPVRCYLLLLCRFQFTADSFLMVKSWANR